MQSSCPPRSKARLAAHYAFFFKCALLLNGGTACGYFIQTLALPLHLREEQREWGNTRRGGEYSGTRVEVLELTAKRHYPGNWVAL